MREVLGREFDLFEQNFLKSQEPEAIARYTRMQVEAGFLAGHYKADTRSRFMEVIMGDQYNVPGQAGTVGPQAHVHDVDFSQVWGQNKESVDLGQLAEQLRTLREAMEPLASEPEEKFAAGAVAAAEGSARQGNGPKVFEYLKTAGRWALGVAEKIGTDLAKEAIKSALGMK